MLRRMLQPRSASTRRLAPLAVAAVALLLVLAAAACGGSGGASSGDKQTAKATAKASHTPASSASAASAPFTVKTEGDEQVTLHERKAVTFTFHIPGGAPDQWVWRVRNYYGKKMSAGKGEPGATTATIRWDGTDPDGKPADSGAYVFEAGPDFSSHMATVGLLRLQAPVKAVVYRSLPAAGKKVALTFDDGGGATAWYWILHELRAGHAKGTFFPIGEYVGDYAHKEAGLTVQDDMAIGSHSWSHPEMTSLSDAEIRKQLQDTDDVWWNDFKASTVPYFRPPYGSYNDRVLKIAGELGYSRIIMWDVDSNDWTSPGTDAIVHNVLSAVHNGSIIVLHTRGKAPKALPRIIDGLHKMGYEMVSLPELFKAAGIK
jgi:peptidoglycan-N-acetylglucosamine deacetylase